MNQKGFSQKIIIFIVIGLIIIGATGYFVFLKKSTPAVQEQNPSPTITQTEKQAIIPPPPPISPKTPSAPDETAEWKTYRNDTYGFEVKYPADWEVSKKEQPEPDSIGFVPIRDRHFFIILIRTHKNRLNLGVREYFDKKYIDKGGFIEDPRAVEYDFYNKLKPSILISGAPSFIYESEPYEIRVIKYRDRIYEITLLKGFSAEDIFNKILSTFKFTK